MTGHMIRLLYCSQAKPNANSGMLDGTEAELLSFEEVAHLRAHRVESVAGDAFTALMHKFNGLLLKTDQANQANGRTAA